MSNTQEKWSEDEAWLYNACEKIGIRPDEDQMENFCERVSVMVVDAKMGESDARRAAFKVVFDEKTKNKND